MKSATLADLYDPLAMPPALAKANAELDRAVDLCHRPEKFDSDASAWNSFSPFTKNSPRRCCPPPGRAAKSPWRPEIYTAQARAEGAGRTRR